MIELLTSMHVRLVLRRAVATAVLSLMHLAVVSSALAQEATPLQRERARGLMDQGDARMAEGDHEAALTAYRAANDIMGVPTTGLEVGKAARKLGLLLEARDAWVQVVRYPRAADEPPPFTAAREEAQRLMASIAELIPTLTLKVEGPSEENFRVFLDEERLSGLAGGVPLRVNPGAHVVRVDADGFVSSHKEVHLKEGQNTTLEFTLAPAAVSPLVVQPPESAERFEITSESSDTGDNPRRSSARRTAAYTAFGLGGAGVIVGTIFGVRAFQLAGKAKENCTGTTCDSAASDPIASSKTAGTISTIGFAFGAAGVATGVTILLTGSRGENPETQQGSRRGAHASWALSSRPGGGEMLLRGEF